MASGTTPVKGWPYPLESDVPDVAADIHSLALSHEHLANCWVGSLAGRSAVTTQTAGDRYVVEGDSTPANNGVEYVWTGSAWSEIAPTWVNLSLASGLGTFAGTYTPAARVSRGTVELRGAVENTSGSTKTSPMPICTIGTAYRPASTVWIATNSFLDNGVGVSITSAGAMAFVADASGLLSGDYVFLDGLSYSLA